jgi:hypothetical protein
LREKGGCWRSPTAITRNPKDRETKLELATDRNIWGKMHPNTRALVAVVAARLVSGDGDVGAVYDHSQSRHILVSGSVSGGQVALYDHDRGCHFSGSGGGYYDHGRGVHVSLQVNGNNVSGYDHDASHHFSGSVSANAVSIYDHGESSHFHYSV